MYSIDCNKQMLHKYTLTNVFLLNCRYILYFAERSQYLNKLDKL